MNKVSRTAILTFILVGFLFGVCLAEKKQYGLLHSRIGYDLEGEKRVVIRNNSKDFLTSNTQFYIYDEYQNVVYRDTFQLWGEKWGEYWWIADFSELKHTGEFTCSVRFADGKELQTKPFKVASNLLWDASWETVALEQLKHRVEFRKNNYKKHGPEHAEGGGWQDCGGYLRETNSHATMLIGLFDLMEYSADKINEGQMKELEEQAFIGLDYLAFCQDKAEELGKGKGAIIHEWPKHRNVITGDVAKGALCFARAAKLLKSSHPGKANEYLDRARHAFGFLDRNGPIHHCGGTDFHGTVQPDDGFNPVIHGAPEGFVRPIEWKTRDLVMMTWVAFELSDIVKVAEYAQKVMERQISKDEKEGKFYGHFKAYASASHSEKAWEHHHMGYDAGATFPHYIIPLLQMVQKFPDHPDISKWDKTIKDFAYGYFLPACSDNPFYLLPMGYYEGEGLLVFSGLWHGMNGAYGSAAALALELQKYTGDSRFEKIATGNLQWIAGLNSGVLEEDRYVSKSMIYGIGDEYIGSWTKIPGTICNGFESDAQFHVEKPKKETDGPHVFTDEGWITHSGGWLSAISRLDR